MKENCFIKRKAYYFFIAIIILSGILIFYLSCESKSPTESVSSLHKQVAVQSTNNSTTSSSTTTSVRPGNTPTNTTTLITSRTLTTTSTSTTTTSIPTAATTSTAKPTTTIASANLEWCNFAVEGALSNRAPNCGDTFTAVLGEHFFFINPQLRNIGQAPAQNVWVILKNVIVSGDFEVTVIEDSAFLGTIPADRSCTMGSPRIFILLLSGEEISGDTVKLVFVETYSRSKCTFTIRIF